MARPVQLRRGHWPADGTAGLVRAFPAGPLSLCELGKHPPIHNFGQSHLCGRVCGGEPVSGRGVAGQFLYPGSGGNCGAAAGGTAAVAAGQSRLSVADGGQRLAAGLAGGHRAGADHPVAERQPRRRLGGSGRIDFGRPGLRLLGRRPLAAVGGGAGRAGAGTSADHLCPAVARRGGSPAG